MKREETGIFEGRCSSVSLTTTFSLRLMQRKSRTTGVTDDHIEREMMMMSVAQ